MQNGFTQHVIPIEAKISNLRLLFLRKVKIFQKKTVKKLNI